MTKLAEGLVFLEEAIIELADHRNIPIDHITAQGGRHRHIDEAIDELNLMLDETKVQQEHAHSAEMAALQAAQLEREEAAKQAKLERDRKRKEDRAAEAAAKIKRHQEKEEARAAEAAAKQAREEAAERERRAVEEAAAAAKEAERVAKEAARVAKEEQTRRAAEEARQAEEKARRAEEERKRAVAAAKRAEEARVEEERREAQARVEKERREAQARAEEERREAQARAEEERRAAQARAEEERRAAQDRERQARKAAAQAAALAKIKGEPDIPMLADAIRNTLCVKNYRIPNHLSSLENIIARFRAEAKATNAGLLKEAVRLRLLDDPFKMYLLQRNDIKTGGDPNVVCSPTADQNKIEVPGYASIPNVFNEVIYENPSSDRNSKENFDKFIKLSNGDSSPNKTFMTYGPSGTGKTTIIKQIIKRECERMTNQLEIRAMMVYVQHDRITNIPREDLGFFKFDCFDMMEVIKDINFTILNYDAEEDEYKMKLAVTVNDTTLPPVTSPGINYSTILYDDVQRLLPMDDGENRSLKFIEGVKRRGNSEPILPHWEDKYSGKKNVTIRKVDTTARGNYLKQCGLPINSSLQKLKDQFNYFKYPKTGFLTDVKATCDGRKYYNIDKHKKNFKATDKISEKLSHETVNKEKEGAGARKVSEIVDKVFNAARYRTTANNKQSSRAILCFFIKYDEFETTYIDLFGNEETIADNSMKINGQFSTEASGIITLLDMIKCALMALRKKMPQTLTTALTDRVSKDIFGENLEHLGHVLSAKDKDQVEANMKAFFNLFTASPAETIKPRDFQLLVTSMHTFASPDHNRLTAQRLNHNTMLKLVAELGAPAKCINANNLDETIKAKFGVSGRDQGRIIREYNLKDMIDDKNAIVNPPSSTLKLYPGFDYGPIFDAELARAKFITSEAFDALGDDADQAPRRAAPRAQAAAHADGHERQQSRTKKQSSAEAKAIDEIISEFKTFSDAVKSSIINDAEIQTNYIDYLKRTNSDDIVQEFLTNHFGKLSQQISDTPYEQPARRVHHAEEGSAHKTATRVQTSDILRERQRQQIVNDILANQGLMAKLNKKRFNLKTYLKTVLKLVETDIENIVDRREFRHFTRGGTRRGRKRRRTVKKYLVPKRKTHYRKFQRSRRTR